VKIGKGKVLLSFRGVHEITLTLVPCESTIICNWITPGKCCVLRYELHQMQCFFESRQYTLRGQMRCKGRHYCFVCACTVLFSLCSLCLTTTPRHSHFTPADFSAGGDRLVSQPGHRLSRVTLVAGFFSHDGKYGWKLYTRQRSLRFASFPIHYNPNIRRYTEC